MPEYKLVVLGTGSVGKSALTVQYINGVFVEKYDPTIEDSYRKSVDVEGESMIVEIIDTAGAEQFHCMRDLYMKDANGFLLIYSVASRSSFLEIQDLHDEIMRIKDRDNFPCVIVGNKCDLESREVSTKDGELLAKKFKNCEFMETSAKCRINVNESFDLLIKNVHKQVNPSLEVKKNLNKARACTLF